MRLWRRLPLEQPRAVAYDATLLVKLLPLPPISFLIRLLSVKQLAPHLDAAVGGLWALVRAWARPEVMLAASELASMLVRMLLAAARVQALALCPPAWRQSVRFLMDQALVPASAQP